MLFRSTERFINAEAGIIEHEGKQGPAIVLSFGDEESLIIDRAISLQDARDIVSDLLSCLSDYGDLIAIKLNNSLLNFVESQEEDED